jgi:hypothetical protein
MPLFPMPDRLLAIFVTFSACSSATKDPSIAPEGDSAIEGPFAFRAGLA